MRTPIQSVVFLLVPLLVVFPALARQKTGQAKQDSLYSKALIASITEMEKAYGRIDDSDGGERVRRDYHHMLVEKDPGITDNLPDQFGQYHVEYLDWQQQIARCRKLRKPFAILKIWPMTNDGAQIKIQVTVYWAEYKKSQLSLALSDWSDVTFRFDCDKQGFVVSNVKLGGI